MNKIMVSGGFDPMHVGHVEMLREAWETGMMVVVALNSDEWLMRKKGYVFMPWVHRREILMATKYVTKVIDFDDSDNTAIDALRKVEPAAFANGGDRSQGNVPEEDYCISHGIKLIYEVGGRRKLASSSDLVQATRKFTN